MPFLSPCALPTGTCPKLEAPMNGRKLGKSHSVGHEVHFLCEPGYELVGSESRVCQESLTWSGQPTACRGERQSPIPYLTCEGHSLHCLLLINLLISLLYNPVIILFVSSPSPAVIPLHVWNQCFFRVWPMIIFPLYVCGHCPKNLLNAVTCDMPTSKWSLTACCHFQITTQQLFDRVGAAATLRLQPISATCSIYLSPAYIHTYTMMSPSFILKH